MKSILLHIGDDEGLEARMQVALDLARAFEGHITCLQAVTYEIFAPGDFYGSAMAAAMPVIRENAEALRKKVEADLANEDVSWEWVFQFGMAESRLLEKSAINDVIVLGPNDIGETGPRPSRMVGDLLLHSRTPVFVVPNGQKKLDYSAPALVAWNGSTEACVALRAAVPLLAKASRVYLATIAEKDAKDRQDLPPVDGAEYLSRYGVHAEIVELPAGDAPVAQSLLAAAEARGCGYMVMGAYGHSRLAEMLLGGVTRKALTDPKIPILMAH
ncbi:universal stress protein [Altererythrobacter sp.]|uniref:universal stress protein n=1 Tax=Altererythrobacter sp. TaxID=1872480 RepID=UPI001B1FAC65|nr:universal stress protein [Altererythrobacter sp.]MBO6609792.1 universal stress protein [Altererythrobacter sp.]MBO6641006.1 universal stress protein [Altererythrobacter sp.]MBO6708296.1 universal stress protein [Altererythrobacter sp.]